MVCALPRSLFYNRFSSCSRRRRCHRRHPFRLKLWAWNGRFGDCRVNLVLSGFGNRGLGVDFTLHPEHEFMPIAVTIPGHSAKLFSVPSDRQPGANLKRLLHPQARARLRRILEGRWYTATNPAGITPGHFRSGPHCYARLDFTAVHTVHIDPMGQEFSYRWFGQIPVKTAASAQLEEGPETENGRLPPLLRGPKLRLLNIRCGQHPPWLQASR